MFYQLWPLYAVSGIFGLMILKNAVVYYWDESTRIAAGDPQETADLITNVTPQETPFMRAMKDIRNAE